MRWQWLVVCLVAGIVLVGCDQRPEPPPPEVDTDYPTAKAALAAVDKSMAEVDKAFESGDVDAIRKALGAADKDLGGLGVFIAEMDLAAEEAGGPAGLLLGKYIGTDRMADAIVGLIPPSNDVAGARMAVADVKKAVEAVRPSIK